jgi:hypothetical protein
MTCPRCGGPVELRAGSGRPREFCSARCAQAERDYRKKMRMAFPGTTTLRKEKTAE